MSISPDVIQILHVDDEPGFAEMAAEFLEGEEARFEVVTETTASAGLERLQAGGFDGVVSDYDMPEMDGLELLKAVRDGFPDLPFVLFTGKGSEEIAAEAISAGVTDYIQKQSGTDQYTILANRLVNAVERYYAVRQTDLSLRAMETAKEGLSLVGPDGTFSYANSAFARLFGYEPEELIGTHWTVLYHNDEAERLEQDILPAVREVGYWSGETVRRTKQGERLITDHRLAYTDEDVIVCTAADVTGERATPTDQASGFDLLTDALEDDAFYTLDHEGYVTRWSDGAQRLTGYEASEILCTHMSEFFTEDDRRAGEPGHLIETAKTEGSVTDEGWRLRKDGSRFWADVTLSASFDEAGTLRGFGKLVQASPNQPAAH
jgi:PAS domain S-box-containing protein